MVENGANFWSLIWLSLAADRVFSETSGMHFSSYGAGGTSTQSRTERLDTTVEDCVAARPGAGVRTSVPKLGRVRCVVKGPKPSFEITLDVRMPDRRLALSGASCLMVNTETPRKLPITNVCCLEYRVIPTSPREGRVERLAEGISQSSVNPLMERIWSVTLELTL